MGKTIPRPWAQAAAFLCCLLLLALARAEARDIVDMKGRTLTIPDEITKVVGVSPPGTYLLYAIDPSLVAGLNFPLWDTERKYTVPLYHRLPVVGGLAGQSRTMNKEVLLKVRPDFLLHWAWREDSSNDKFLASMATMPFPVVCVRMEGIADYPQALRFVGNVTGRKARGEELASYAEEALAKAATTAAAIPRERWVRVYYAEGTDGLSTEREHSVHAELIPLAGGINVHKGAEVDHYGMEKISMEQLLLYDPEIILVKERAFFTTISADPRWKRLKAVREGRVHLIPYAPFNWFDRPPSFMRLLGVKWLLNLLHPEAAPFDMVAETRTFYSLFLGVTLSDDEAREVLNR